MIGWIVGAWNWLGSKFLHISIWIGVTAAVLWQVYIAGARKQALDALKKEKSDADRRNKISAEVDASSTDANRKRLHDRWSQH